MYRCRSRLRPEAGQEIRERVEKDGVQEGWHGGKKEAHVSRRRQSRQSGGQTLPQVPEKEREDVCQHGAAQGKRSRDTRASGFCHYTRNIK